MMNYISERQLSIEELKAPFQSSLLGDNRWVGPGRIVPWDSFASLYMSMMGCELGRPGISPRMALGALIIGHIENLDDRGAIATIEENVYMQFFVGLKGFCSKPIFGPPPFVGIRKGVGASTLDKSSTDLIKSAGQSRDRRHSSKKDKDDDPKLPSNKGRPQMGATVADQYISCPTDAKVLNSGRKQCEKMTDKLYAPNDKKGTKPRTYGRKMDTAFLDCPKKKRKTGTAHRKMDRKLLECVKRGLSYTDKLLDIFVAQKRSFPLTYKEQKTLWAVHTVYEQQKQVCLEKPNSCKDGIVSAFQPHVRPVPRGKVKAKIGSGPKLGVSSDQGLARINTLSWGAHNEPSDLILQVEAHRTLHGYCPELVQADKIYATGENRKWLKERAIRAAAAPLGRKSKEQIGPPYYKKRKPEAEARERNQIEGKFGQGKNGYSLNKIRARPKETSQSWIATIFFVMNLIHYKKTFPFWLFSPVLRGANQQFLHSKGLVELICQFCNWRTRKNQSLFFIPKYGMFCA